MSQSHADQKTRDLWREDGYLRTSDEWVEYFESNKAALMPIPWASRERLSGEAKRVIGRSMATFQLGESSDGSHFMAAGRAYATDSGDATYLDALSRFIAEEHCHAHMLARFMEQEGIPLLKQQWSDRIFRAIRKLADLNVCISVLITAEIIAKSYYQALRDATTSCVLRAMCDQILRDEIQHIFFQSGVLGKIRHKQSLFRLAMAESLQRLLMTASLVVVWIDHRRVYRAGGFRFRSFAGSAWQALSASLQIVRECAILSSHATHQLSSPALEKWAMGNG